MKCKNGLSVELKHPYISSEAIQILVLARLSNILQYLLVRLRRMFLFLFTMIVPVKHKNIVHYW